MVCGKGRGDDAIPCASLPGVLRLRGVTPHQDAAHEAAVEGNRDAYLQALRRYMRAGRGVAVQARLEARKGAA